MSYITKEIEVEINANDFSDDELLEIIQLKLENYRKRNTILFKSFKNQIIYIIDDYSTVNYNDLVFTDLPDSILEEQTVNVLKKLAKKYNLEELEALL